MTATTSAPVSYPDRFFIGGEWVAPSSDATIDVIDSGTEELFFSVAEAQAERHGPRRRGRPAAFDEGPWPAHDPRRAGRVPPRPRRRGPGTQRRPRPRSGRGSPASLHTIAQYSGDDGAGAFE